MTDDRDVNERGGFYAFFGDDEPRAPVRPAMGPKPIRIGLPARRTQVDALLPLINIVFLLLIFLMMSGTIGRPLPAGIGVARTTDADDPATLAAALVVFPDGSLRYRGQPVSAAALDAALRGADGSVPARVTVVADAAMPAEGFLDAMSRLSSLGVETISLVTSNAR